MRVPLELIELVFLELPVNFQFTLSVRFRILRVRDAIIRSNPRITMCAASVNYNLSLLQWFKDKGYNPETAIDQTCYASMGGPEVETQRLSVLNWWEANFRQDCKYSVLATALASARGNIALLDWFAQSSLPFKWDHQALNMASLTGQVHVLDWWRARMTAQDWLAVESSQGKPCIWAAKHGNVDVLDWWASLLDDGVISWEGAGFDMVPRYASDFETLAWYCMLRKRLRDESTDQ